MQKLLPLILMMTTEVAFAERASIIRVNFADSLLDKERRELRSLIENSLAASNFQLMSEPQERQAEELYRDLIKCYAEARCQRELGQKLSATILLSGSIAHEGTSWIARLSLFDVETGSEAKSAQASCFKCNQAKFSKSVEGVIRELLVAHKDLPRATVSIETRPSGLQVSVDDRPAQLSDYQLRLLAGTHHARVFRAGVVARESSFELMPAEHQVVKFDFSVEDKTSRRPLIVGGALIGVGAAVAIAGIPLIVLDGKTFNDDLLIYDTKIAGISLCAVGGAVVLAGAIVAGVGSRKPAKHAARSTGVSF